MLVCRLRRISLVPLACAILGVATPASSPAPSSSQMALIAMLPAKATDLGSRLDDSPKTKSSSDTLGQEYFPDGSLKARAHFRNGKLQGLEEGFLRAGVLSYKRTYQNGLLHGLETVFQSDGKGRTMEVPWVEGKVQGDVKLYHREGTLRALLHFERDTLDGKAETFWVGGQLLSQGSYRRGKIHGVTLHFASDGTVFSRVLYYDGKCVRNCS